MGWFIDYDKHSSDTGTGWVNSYMHDLRVELDAEILAKDSFTHNGTIFTYYLN